MENREAMTMSEEPGQGRSAFGYEPAGSPAVINVHDLIRLVLTRNQPVLTVFAAFQRQPSSYTCVGGFWTARTLGNLRLYPKSPLLGPSLNSHLWATRPDTEFLMVNLAPGATRKLFDIEPGDIREQIETLSGHDLAMPLQQSAMDGARGPAQPLMSSHSAKAARM